MDQDTINASGGEKQKAEGKSYDGRRSKFVRQSLVKQNWNAILEFLFFF